MWFKSLTQYLFFFFEPGKIALGTLSQKYPMQKKGWWSGSSGTVPA
jgi:hypothetical protein